MRIEMKSPMPIQAMGAVFAVITLYFSYHEMFVTNTEWHLGSTHSPIIIPNFVVALISLGASAICAYPLYVTYIGKWWIEIHDRNAKLFYGFPPKEFEIVDITGKATLEGSSSKLLEKWRMGERIVIKDKGKSVYLTSSTFSQGDFVALTEQLGIARSLPSESKGDETVAKSKYKYIAIFVLVAIIGLYSLHKSSETKGRLDVTDSIAESDTLFTCIDATNDNMSALGQKRYACKIATITNFSLEAAKVKKGATECATLIPDGLKTYPLELGSISVYGFLYPDENPVNGFLIETDCSADTLEITANGNVFEVTLQ